MNDRILPNTETVYTANDEIPRQHPAGVEGQEMSGEVWLKVVMKSETMLMLQVFREKGVKDPVHRHDDARDLLPSHQRAVETHHRRGDFHRRTR